MSRLSTYLQLMRFPLVFTAIADVTAGYYLVTGDSLSLTTALLLAAVSSALYTGGMVLNDVCDVRRDRDLHPYRPLVQGVISRAEGAGLAAVLLGGGVGLSFLLDGPRRWATLAAVAAVVLYDGGAKNYAVPGLVAMGLCRLSNFSIGAGMIHPAGWVIFSYTVLLTGVSLVEEEWRPYKNRYLLLLPLFGVALAATLIFTSPHPVMGRIAAIPLGIGLIWIAYRLYQAESPPQIGKCVRDLILGITLVDVVLVVAYTGSPWGWAWGLWIIPAVVLMKVFPQKRRHSRAGGNDA